MGFSTSSSLILWLAKIYSTVYLQLHLEPVQNLQSLLDITEMERHLSILLLIFSMTFQVHTIEFTCYFSMHHYETLRNYSCYGEIAENGRNYDHVTGIFGYHLTDKDNYQVEVLLMERQQLTFFPRDIETFFPNVKIIDLSVNSISTVQNLHLKPFPDLERLSLAHNQICELESSLFNGLPKLKVINFIFNNIIHVGYDIHLPAQGYLYFFDNHCIDKSAWTTSSIIELKLALRELCPPVTQFNKHTKDLKNNYRLSLDTSATI